MMAILSRPHCVNTARIGVVISSIFLSWILFHKLILENYYNHAMMIYHDLGKNTSYKLCGTKLNTVDSSTVLNPEKNY